MIWLAKLKFLCHFLFAGFSFLWFKEKCPSEAALNAAKEGLEAVNVDFNKYSLDDTCGCVE